MNCTKAGVLVVSSTDVMNRKIPEKFVWHVFHSMALALYTLHTHRIYAYAWNEVEEGRGETIHRDIKPQNIFLRYKNDDKNPGYSDVYPQCVLGDFDLAELASDLKDLKDGSHIAGTHGYMAPVSTTYTSCPYPCKKLETDLLYFL